MNSWATSLWTYILLDFVSASSLSWEFFDIYISKIFDICIRCFLLYISFSLKSIPMERTENIVLHYFFKGDKNLKLHKKPISMSDCWDCLTFLFLLLLYKNSFFLICMLLPNHNFGSKIFIKDKRNGTTWQELYICKSLEHQRFSMLNTVLHYKIIDNSFKILVKNALWFG